MTDHNTREKTDPRSNARDLTAEDECPDCNEPLVRYVSSNPVVGRAHVAAIQDAVDHANMHPPSSALDADGDLVYTVEDGYYPGEWSHWIDLSEIDPENRRSASTAAGSELAERGLMINSVDFAQPRLHVVAASWMTARHPTIGGSDR